MGRGGEHLQNNQFNEVNVAVLTNHELNFRVTVNFFLEYSSKGIIMKVKYCLQNDNNDIDFTKK